MRTPQAICLLLAAMMLSGGAPARGADRQWPLDGSMREADGHPRWRVLAEDAAGVELEVRFPRVDLREEADGLRLLLPGEGRAGLAGDWALPAASRLLVGPDQARGRLTLLEADSLSRGDLRVGRERTPGSDRVDGGAPLALAARGGGDAPWASLEEGGLWLGRRVSGLTVRPVRVDPVRGRTVVLSRLRLRVDWEAADLPAPLRRSGALDNDVRAAVLNGDSPLWAEAGRTVAVATPGDYLVVTSDAALPFLGDWLAHKREAGHGMRVLKESDLGGNPGFEELLTAIEGQFAARPFEFLLLVGDVDAHPSGTETNFNLEAGFIDGGQYSESDWASRCASAQCIVADHLFSLLEGDDYFSDVLVGRWSVDNANDVVRMAERSRAYEAEPFEELGGGWHSKGLMIYDVSEAPSRAETKQAIRDLLLAEAGFTQVDTIRNRYSGGAVHPQVVVQRINSGVSLINYRGYGYRNQWYGPEFGVWHMNDLTNVGRWPLVTSIVCGGGDFASVDDDPSLGEAFLRAGSVVEPTGAVGFIGPSEEDTHTEWNNCIDEGLYHGIARDGLRRMGSVLDRGKLELWLNYPTARSWGQTGYNVPFYFHTYSLQGDPGLELRLSAPRPLVVEAPANRPAGMEWLEVRASAQDGLPLDGLRACLYDPRSQIARLAQPDADGRLVFDCQGLSDSTWVLTLTGADYLPLRRELPRAGGEQLVVADWSLAGAPPEDGLARPGERLELSLTLHEAGDAASPAARRLTLELPAAAGEALGGGVLLDEVPPGSSLAVPPLPFRLASLLPYGEEIPLILRLDGALLARLSLPVAQPGFQLDSLRGAGPIDAGYQGPLSIRLRGLGLPAGEPLVARIGSLHDGVVVVDSVSAVFELEPAGLAWVEGFALDVSPGLVAGTLAACELGIWRAAQPQGALLALLPFQLQVGRPVSTDPFGPDGGGYLAWHSGDEGAFAPDPAWSSIAASGQEVDLDDVHDPWYESLDGVSHVVELPFTFRFYGVDYQRVTLCSNGWLAFGDHVDHWTAINTGIPAAQGPPAMVAGWWTDLINYWYNPDVGLYGRWGHLYTESRPDDGLFIAEWNGFRIATGVGDVDLQIVLRDPAVWPTPTGDGEILLQLHDIYNPADAQGATVGIESPSETDGLQVLFAGQRAPASQPLVDGCALLFRPQEAQNALEEPATRPGARLEIHPNPFNPVARVSLELPAPARLRWELCNLLGQTVRDSGEWLGAPAGRWNGVLDGAGLASGVYLLRAQWQPLAGGTGGVAVEKVLLLK